MNDETQHIITIKIKCSQCGRKSEYIVSGNGTQKCRKCGIDLYCTQVVVGFIYLLYNPSFPNYIKIGYTSRDVTDRVKELSQATGLPTSFKILAFFSSFGGQQDELSIHKLLDKYRVKQGREFFDIDLLEGIDQIEKFLGKEPIFVDQDEIKKFNNARVKPVKPLAQEPPSKEHPETMDQILKAGICPKCNIKMRPLKKGGFKCRKCGSMYR